MSKQILLFMAFFFPLSLFAQEDSKYLAGAVPEVNGKVIFAREINALALSKDQIFDGTLQWANTRFNAEEKRVVYQDKEKGQIAAMGDEYIVFSSSMLSLDRAKIKYKLVLYIDNSVCRVEMSGIRYEYNVSYQKEPERYTAEEWITDSYALNKGKLTRGNGKFRKATLDLVDDIVNQLSDALGTPRKSTVQAVPVQAAATQPAAQVPRAGSNAPIQQTTATVETVPAISVSGTPATGTMAPGQVPPGYKEITPDKIPGNITKMMSEDWMLITAGKENDFNMMTASWGALGYVFGKPAFFCFINPKRYTYQLMEKNDVYTLTFYTEAYREALKYCGSHTGATEDKVKGSGLTPLTLPSGSKAFGEAWMIIECKKMMSQPLNADSFNNEELRNEWSQKLLNKMFIGEIIHVWIK